MKKPLHIKLGPLTIVGNVLKCGPIERIGGHLRIGALHIRADRFPWQGYGWAPHKDKNGEKRLNAPLNPSGARFGGGWNYKLGIDIGGKTVIINVLFGTIRCHWESAKEKSDERI